MAGTFKEALLRASLLGGICHCLISQSYGMKLEEMGDNPTEINIRRIKDHKPTKPSLADIERLHKDHSLLTTQDIDQWITYAGTGDLVSLYHLGWLIDKREKSNQSFAEKDKAHTSILGDAKTFYWWKRAQNQDDLEAWIELGILYHIGLGVERDQVEAMKWYLKAVDQNLGEENMEKKYKLGLLASALGLLQVEAIAMEFTEDPDKNVINVRKESDSEEVKDALKINPESVSKNAPSDDEKVTKTPQEQLQIEIEQLKKEIKLINDTLPNKPIEHGIAMLGLTGSGKSTLFNYLLNVPLYRQTRDFDVFIGAEEGLKSKIGSGYNSETTHPAIGEDPDKAGSYYDFAGFRSTITSEGISPLTQDIINYYSIYKLLNNTENIKILLVATENQIKGKNDFIPVIQQLAGMFPSVDITQNLCMVITQCEKIKSVDQFQSFLGKNCREVSLPSDQKKITDFLSSSENSQRIAFFDSPKNEGEISPENKKAIREAIKNTDFLQNLTPKFSVMQASELLIENLSGGIVQKISNVINSFDKKISEYCAEFIENKIQTGSITTAALFREKFKGFVEYLPEVCAESKFNADANKFQNLLEELSPELGSELSKLLEAHKVLELVGSPPIETANIFSSLSNARTLITDLSTEPPEFDTNFSIFSGALIGMSDVNQKVDVNNCSKIKIISTHSILFDENLEMPGGSIVLGADHWFVLGDNKRVNLKGADGKKHNTPKASDGEGFKENTNGEGNDGCDGLLGLPGQNGGDFQGEGKKFYNLKNLTIDVSGGNGGKGQNGGNGGKGQDGKDGDKDAVKNRILGSCVERTEILSDEQFVSVFKDGVKQLLTLDNKKFLEIYESGSLEKPGGNAGNPGKGGRPGDEGNVNIYEKKLENCQITAIKDHQTIGGKGDPGDPGDPGEKGNDGASSIVYQGTYIAEYSPLEMQMRGIKTCKRNGEKTSENNTQKSIRIVLTDTAIGGGLGALVYSVVGATGQKVLLIPVKRLVKEVVIPSLFEKAVAAAGGAGAALLGETVAVGIGATGVVGGLVIAGVAIPVIFTGSIAAVGLGLLSPAAKIVEETIIKRVVEEAIPVGLGATAISGVLSGVGLNVVRGVLSYISASTSSKWKDEPHEVARGIRDSVEEHKKYIMNLKEVKERIELSENDEQPSTSSLCKTQCQLQESSEQSFTTTTTSTTSTTTPIATHSSQPDTVSSQSSVTPEQQMSLIKSINYEGNDISEESSTLQASHKQAEEKEKIGALEISGWQLQDHGEHI